MLPLKVKSLLELHQASPFVGSVAKLRCAVQALRANSGLEGLAICKSQHAEDIQAIVPGWGHNCVGQEAIAFNTEPGGWSEGSVLKLIYRLRLNDYFAGPPIQLVVEHIDIDA